MTILTPNSTRLDVTDCRLVDTKYISRKAYDESFYFTFETMSHSQAMVNDWIDEAVRLVENNNFNPDVIPSKDVLDPKGKNFQVSQFQKPRFSFDYQDPMSLDGLSVSLVLHLRDDKNGCVRISCDWINQNAA